METLLVALVVAVIGPVIIVWWSGRQRSAEKEQDYKRQDEVAAEALRQQAEVAEQAARAAKLLLERQDEVAKQAEGVAELLLAAQRKTTSETAEVARLAAGSGAPPSKTTLHATYIPVTLSYPNGNRAIVVLADVPRVGESIRQRNGVEDPTLMVEHVLWIEGNETSLEPYVIVSVSSRKPGNQKIPDG